MILGKPYESSSPARSYRSSSSQNDYHPNFSDAHFEPYGAVAGNNWQAQEYGQDEPPDYQPGQYEFHNYLPNWNHQASPPHHNYHQQGVSDSEHSSVHTSSGQGSEHGNVDQASNQSSESDQDSQHDRDGFYRQRDFSPDNVDRTQPHLVHSPYSSRGISERSGSSKSSRRANHQRRYSIDFDAGDIRETSSDSSHGSHSPTPPTSPEQDPQVGRNHRSLRRYLAGLRI